MIGQATQMDENKPQAEAMAPCVFVSTSLNPYTQLSSDFLNQFNEVAMILEMLAEWPEGLEDLHNWRPRGYIEHFENSGFHDADTVIEAYQNAPRRIRTRFEAHIRELDDVIKIGLDSLLRSAMTGMNLSICGAGQALAIEVHDAVMRLSRIINTSSTGADQQQIDDLIAAQF